MAADAKETLPIPEPVVDLFDGKLRVGFMSTIRTDGHAAIVPIGVMIHEGLLRISSRTDTAKVRNLQGNPNISVCVTDPEDPTRYVTIRGKAELADDIDRAFVNWMARTHMGVDEYPYEPADIARIIITVHPERFSMPKVHGSKG